jgi:hypothetical protein
VLITALGILISRFRAAPIIDGAVR